MKRREFLRKLGAAGAACATLPVAARAAQPEKSDVVPDLFQQGTVPTGKQMNKFKESLFKIADVTSGRFYAEPQSLPQWIPEEPQSLPQWIPEPHEQRSYSNWYRTPDKGWKTRYPSVFLEEMKLAFKCCDEWQYAHSTYDMECNRWEYQTPWVAEWYRLDRDPYGVPIDRLRRTWIAVRPQGVTYPHVFDTDRTTLFVGIKWVHLKIELPPESKGKHWDKESGFLNWYWKAV